MPKTPIAIATSLLVPACSFGMQGPPRDYRPAQHGQPSCTDSKSTVTMDGVGAGAAFTLSVLMAAAAPAKDFLDEPIILFPGQYPNEGRESASATDYIPAGVLFATGVTYAIAATRGSRTADRCRQAKADDLRYRKRNATDGDHAAESSALAPGAGGLEL